MGVADTYFAKVLLPVLPPSSVIVLDNARFHQSPTTQNGTGWLLVAVLAALLARPQPHRTSLSRLQDSPASKPPHRYQQSLSFYRQYLPTLRRQGRSATCCWLRRCEWFKIDL
jgi:hypothetical protein